MLKRAFIISYRLFFAGLVVAAIIMQIKALVRAENFSPLNFFSFFTIQSNMFAASLFVLGAILLLRGDRWEDGAGIRSAAALYMVMTGVIYAILLSRADVQTPLPWVNDVLHKVFPVVVAIDWLFDPPRFALPLCKALWWLTYPVLYLAYSLGRGAIVHWYPYPFINPVHGYARLILTSLIIAAAVTLAVIGISRMSAFLAVEPTPTKQ